MNRTGLIVAALIAGVGGLAFGLLPSLDLGVARIFYNVRVSSGLYFGWRFSPGLTLIHDILLKAGFLVVLAVLLALALKLVVPRRRMLVSPRAAIFLIVTMLLGPGLLVNVALKDHWGRPRPIDVTQFGGEEHFVAWWDPNGDCQKNCSFVSGDVATVAWILAPAALVPAPWLGLAYGGALALTIFMAAMRIMAGAHFASDTIFAVVFTYFLIWLSFALIYRWPATRLNNEAIEASLERFSSRCFERMTLLVRRTGRDKNN